MTLVLAHTGRDAVLGCTDILVQYLRNSEKHRYRDIQLLGHTDIGI